MSSEALREAKVWLEQLASADRELVRTSGLAAALLAEVARLEQTAREQRLSAAISTALTSLATGPAKDGYAYSVLAAALVDEPAAATLAEPEQAEAQGEAAASRSGQGSLDGNAQGSGSASAAADELQANAKERRTLGAAASAVVWSEPRQDYPGGRVYREGLATGTPSAAADEPGETP